MTLNKLIKFLFSFLLAIIFTSFVSSEARLTHVVMPFHQRQFETVQKNLNSWSRFPPCKSDQPVEFIFFVSGMKNDSLASDLLKLPQSKCFESFRVEFGYLEDENDAYLKGSRLMFEIMISRKLNYGNTEPSHVFYMEPDCSPIRPYWLEAIQNQVIAPNSPFWMKGSIYYGRSDIIKDSFLYNRVHINGNAIYNVADDDFREFYFKFVRPFVKKYYPGKGGAYDTDIYKFLFWKNAMYTAHLFHLFQFSDFIQNHWHSEFSLKDVLKSSPNTFLIHGGEARE